ncbi:MAG: flagellar hook-basal body complex protein FliE [Oscillospiraceae bacterium]|nr:flagellar hook-basal body complex protein FliE [Oscillospiraceae bacterium]MBP1577285.1 flagellar hook-basal body complex protein FliE [Oscillospiraceae bacterium]
MFIVPISELQPIASITERNTVNNSAPVSGRSFDSVLKNAVKNLEEVQAVSDKDAMDLALGRSDDLHTIQINTMKATAAIELTTNVTSKVLSAYKEIINMQL